MDEIKDEETVENIDEPTPSSVEKIPDTEDAPIPTPDEEDTGLAGGIFEEKREKQPLFVLDERKPGCVRDDRLYMISKKVGFFGLISFLILSIVFGAINKVWENSLNLLFMGLAVLAYGIQDIIHLKAISRCSCTECTILSKKLKNIIILCVTVAVVLIILFGVKQFATF